MERIVHQLVQGSPEWEAFRFQHDGASEIKTVMGLDKKTTRAQLLRMKATGATKEFSAWVQENVLNRGHEIEALARPFAVEFAGVDGFYPATVSIGRLSASSDGLDMPDETAWECKSLNQENGPIVKSGRVPDEHMPQCQQVLMVTGADRLLFTVSDGTRENTHHVWVEPDTDWFDRIRAEWKQFHEDLANYQHVEQPAAPIGKAPEALPALFIQVKGEVTDSNLAAFKDHALAVFGSINRTLVTDDDFANAAKAVTWCGEVETRLAAAKQHALSQTESIDKLFRTIDDISEEARKVRLELDKLVKARKESRRMEILADHAEAFGIHMTGLQKRLGRDCMPDIPTDFAGAMRGLKTFSSMIDKCGVELARAKIEANAVADRISANIEYLREHAQEHSFLFADRAVIVRKAHDDLRALVENRIATHAKAEADRLERERARIAFEERVKAEKALREEQEARDRAADLERRNAEAKALEAVVPPAPPQVQPEPEQAAPVPVQTFTPPAPYVAERQETSPPTMTNGKVCQILGFNVTADFLVSIGAPAPTKQGNANLWHERQIVNIVEALGQHLQAVHTAQKAKYQPARSRTPA